MSGVHLMDVVVNHKHISNVCQSVARLIFLREQCLNFLGSLHQFIEQCESFEGIWYICFYLRASYEAFH